MYLRENGYEDCVQKAKNHKSYYVVEQEDEVLKDKYGKTKKVLKYGALSVLLQYKKSLTSETYFKF